MVVEEGTTKGKASVSKAIHSMGSDGFPQECLWAKHLLERHAPVFLGDGIGRGTVYSGAELGTPCMEGVYFPHDCGISFT